MPGSGSSPPSTARLHERRERVFLVLAGIFLGTLAMLNILGISRFIVLASWGATEAGWIWRWGARIPASIDPEAWTFAVPVGVLPYPITFLCTDLISELYGRRRATFLVVVGLLLNLWVVFVLWLGGVLPEVPELDPETGLPPFPVEPDTGEITNPGAAAEWAFYEIRSLTFGAVTASMVAYVAAQLCDVRLFHFWKRVTRGRLLWVRNNGSTLVSQLVDTTAVVTITHFYAGALPIREDRPLLGQLAVFVLTAYAFKVLAAAVDTLPFYLGVRWLSRYLRLERGREHHADEEAVELAWPLDGER